MNCNAPAYYIDESVEQAMKDTRDTIEHVKNIDPKYDLISPIVTPRFAVSCTSELLFELGKLAKEEDLPIQTHISENVAEIDFVSDLFPEDGCYTKVYDNAGLLTNRTILAHAVHITKPELKLISKRGAKVSHCPVSNSSLGSGMAKVREILDAGVDVGLGTDVSGGYSTSVLESARQALLVSRLVANLHKEDRAKLSVAEILYLGTLGGAKVMGLQDKIGNFAVGKEWDAIMVGLNEVPIPNDEEGDANENLEDDPGVTGNVDIFEGQSNWEDILAKWVYTGDDRNNLCVWVKGRLVHDKRKGVINVGGGASGLSLLN